MNYFGVHLAPALLEEGWRELERERGQRRRIREARKAQRAERPSRFSALSARARHALRRDPCPQLAEGC